MSYEDVDNHDDWPDEEEDAFACPECGTEVHAEAEACPSCGYWITDDEREAGWQDGSASQRIRAIGWWVIGVSTIGMLLLWW